MVVTPASLKGNYRGLRSIILSPAGGTMNSDLEVSSDAAAKSKVDWRQFSIKSLLLLMLLATAFFAGLRRRL